HLCRRNRPLCGCQRQRGPDVPVWGRVQHRGNDRLLTVEKPSPHLSLLPRGGERARLATSRRPACAPGAATVHRFQLHHRKKRSAAPAVNRIERITTSGCGAPGISPVATGASISCIPCAASIVGGAPP